MSLVFPNALAPDSTNTALARGAFWFGMVDLAAAALCMLLLADGIDPVRVAPIFGGLALVAAGGVVAARGPGPFASAAVGAALLALGGNAAYVAEVLPHLGPEFPGDMIFITLPKIAIIMFGVVAGRYLSGIASIVVAFALAECPALAVALLFGLPLHIDVASIVFAVVLVLIRLLLAASRARSRASEPAITRAHAEEISDTERALRERATTALVHDTILNELAVIGTVAPGTLSPAAREHIMASVAVLQDHDQSAFALRPAPAEAGRIVAAVAAAARADGLDVTVNGETSSVDLLDPARSEALRLAVIQCLANVRAHAGTPEVEVSVIATESQVCVMVIDSGVGFIEGDVADDRLGLRNSVRGRLASVGGSVQVWSAPDAGTAVSLVVPR